MNSIESLKLDFDSQIRELNKIDNEKIFDECIYVGSGDSYVAGLIAEFLTNHKCRCYSPSDLSNSRFLQDKIYCFISVTGRTNANIEIARRATLLEEPHRIWDQDDCCYPKQKQQACTCLQGNSST